MADYIKREDALAAQNKSMNLNEMRERLKCLPAADVAEVRHGRWIWDDNGMDWGLGAWKCSVCHSRPETWWEAAKGNPYRCSGSHYCPNCGAKMTEDYHEQKE